MKMPPSVSSDPTPTPVKSSAALVGDVVRQGSDLIHKEVELARAELSQKMKMLKIAVGELIAGTVLVVVSLGILLAALVSGVARLLMATFAADVDAETLAAADPGAVAMLESARALSTYEGLAALLVGVVFAGTGGLLLRNGLDKLDMDALTLDRTLRQLGKDGKLASEQL
jgi:hypothetical protein